ncbi:MAG: hypothetical protein R3318_05305 [Gammaproteobacteria bacterium]|nr:hypothetical protein [Gammaproteobacteria bacterium]
MIESKLLKYRVIFTALLAGITTPCLAISQFQGQRPSSLYENRTCEQLYLAAGKLENKALNYESDVYNQRNNTVAGIVSTVFTPALYFLGYSSLMSFKSDREAYHSNLELNKIRFRMAEMRCFQR